MENSNYIGKYGTFPWYDTCGDPENVHPDGRHKFIQFDGSFTSICHCIGQDGDYLVFQFGDIVFRGRPKNFHPLLQTLKFEANETVRVKNRDPEMIGTVYDVQWHFDRATPIYLLNVNGKKKKRWYFEDEMEKPEASGGTHES